MIPRIRECEACGAGGPMVVALGADLVAHKFCQSCADSGEAIAWLEVEAG